MSDYKPNDRRASQAVICVWIVMVIGLAVFISTLAQFFLLKEIASSPSADYASFYDKIESNNTRQMTISFFYLVMWIISGIFFLRWFYRAYSNMHLKAEKLDYSSNWTILGWFIPIGNFFLPFLIMREIYTRTEELLVKNNLSYEQKGTAYVTTWWILYVSSCVLGFVYKFIIDSETIDGLMVATIVSMILFVLLIPLAIVTVKVIRDYSDLEYSFDEVPDLGENDADIKTSSEEQE